MVRMRYVGGGDVILVRRNGEQVELKNGAEIDLTEEEAAGCACRPERADGSWERVTVAGKGRPKELISTEVVGG